MSREKRLPVWDAFTAFLRAKDLPRTTRVVGGIRRAYLHPDRVRVIEGRDDGR